MPKPKPTEKLERVLFLLPPAIVRAIDDYRFASRFPSRVAAVRQLLIAGLQAVDDHRAALRVPGRPEP